jgi:hypothetical protein
MELEALRDANCKAWFDPDAQGRESIDNCRLSPNGRLSEIVGFFGPVGA